MPARTAMNQPEPAVPGTSAFFYVTAEALSAGLFPQIAHALWPVPGLMA